MKSNFAKVQLGNWRRFITDPVGDNEIVQIRQHNGLNQITSVQDNGEDKTHFEYDLNGNLLNDGIRKYEWDALNRLVKVYKDPNGTPTLIAEYVYDALGRRIRKTVSNGGLSGNIPNGTTDCIYNSSWQCVEERDGSDDVIKQFVWGKYIDELLQMKTFVEINGHDAGEYYALQDLLYRTTALLNSSGEIIETYDCDAYGNTLIFTAPGTANNWWADDVMQGENPTCDRIFTGQQFDPETRLYHFRNRPYDPVTGRFPSRDPIGYVGGINLYRGYFVPDGVDPFGNRDRIEPKEAYWRDDMDQVLSYNVPNAEQQQRNANLSITCRNGDVIPMGIGDNCSGADLAMISNAACKLSEELSATQNFLVSLIPRPGGRKTAADQIEGTRRLVYKWFAETEGHVPDERQYDKLILNFGKVSGGMHSGDPSGVMEISCGGCFCDDNTWGYLHWFTNTIVLCRNAFDAGIHQLKSTLLHELLHRYPGLKDHGYAPPSHDDHVNTYYQKGYLYGYNVFSLTQPQLESNASTYQRFHGDIISELYW